MYKIEKGIPIPSVVKGRRTIYPFQLMECGDSFSVPVPSGTIARQVRSHVYTAIKRWQVTHKSPYQFILATADDKASIRCWRVL